MSLIPVNTLVKLLSLMEEEGNLHGYEIGELINTIAKERIINHRTDNHYSIQNNPNRIFNLNESNSSISERILSRFFDDVDKIESDAADFDDEGIFFL